jgi:hypothetical protein
MKSMLTRLFMNFFLIFSLLSRGFGDDASGWDTTTFSSYRMTISPFALGTVKKSGFLACFKMNARFLWMHPPPVFYQIIM